MIGDMAWTRHTHEMSTAPDTPEHAHFTPTLYTASGRSHAHVLLSEAEYLRLTRLEAENERLRARLAEVADIGW